MLCAHRLVFRQVPPRLPHDPDGHPRDGFASARAQEKLLLGDIARKRACIRGRHVLIQRDGVFGHSASVARRVGLRRAIRLF